ncbi:stage II sporulation protein M [Candidatus Woesearchaeota archaeon]|nr:stage II sporulation protein M [Candidatus Woesearchaeota archaeon]
MVLESLTNPFKAQDKPLYLFLIGALYATAGLFLGNWIFREYASLIMVFLTVMACIPLLYNTFHAEEEKEVILDEEKEILKQHGRILIFLLFLFLGIVAAFVLWYVVLPSSWIQNSFHSQTLTIQSISTRIATGGFSNINTFTIILLNNLKVLIFCILFSFLYGAGAIFILTWNASVIATAIGNYIRTNITSLTTQLGLFKYAAYFKIISIGLLKYFVHGIPEIAAYFIGGIAGGIISVAVIRESFSTRNFEKIILDSSNLIIISIIILIVAAFIEVYITPALF